MKTYNCSCNTCQVSSHTLRVKGRSSYQVSLHLLPQGGKLSEAELPVPAVLLSSWGSYLTYSFVSHLHHLYRVRTSLTVVQTDVQPQTSGPSLIHTNLHTYYWYFYLTLYFCCCTMIHQDEWSSLSVTWSAVISEEHTLLKPSCWLWAEQNRTSDRAQFWLQSAGRLQKDTSIRLTMTLQVSRLKPSVLMSVPVRERQEVIGEQVSRWGVLKL